MLNAVIIARTEPRRQRPRRFICIYCCCTFRGAVLFIPIQLKQFFPHKAMETRQQDLSPLSLRVSGRCDAINKYQQQRGDTLGTGCGGSVPPRASSRRSRLGPGLSPGAAARPRARPRPRALRPRPRGRSAPAPWRPRSAQPGPRRQPRGSPRPPALGHGGLGSCLPRAGAPQPPAAFGGRSGPSCPPSIAAS